MNRRDFIKGGAALGAVSLGGYGVKLLQGRHTQSQPVIPYYRGFNLLAKFSGEGPRRKFSEQDFEIMAELGFNFARIPMSYWSWSSPDDWYSMDEEVMKDIDQVVEFGRQYNIHINLNFHRLPGYCINGREREPVDLFDDTHENMKKALDAAVFQWRTFSARYKGIPNSQLSFDLINEPPWMNQEIRYIAIVRALVKAIREEEPDRLIFADGKMVGRLPVLGITDLDLVQSTRGYDPMTVSHYRASWVDQDGLESSGVPTWPLKADDGTLWDRAVLKEKLIDPWKPVVDMGIPVHVGEWGCYNKTPHEVALSWMRDLLTLWKEAGWGNAMWNLSGSFGILDSGREDVRYESYKGHKLDRKMLELLQEFE